METPSSTEELPVCPTCGGQMLSKPASDDTDYITICPTCTSDHTNNEIDKPDISHASQEEDSDPGTRFRKLVSQFHETNLNDPVPDSLLEGLSEEARSLLSGEATPPTSPPEKFSDDIASSLRAQDYLIDQDAHGVRLIGGFVPSDGSSGAMSSSDIVRLAADLQGGVLPPQDRAHCTKCDAVIPVENSKCQWCGEPAPPPQESSGDE